MAVRKGLEIHVRTGGRMQLARGVRVGHLMHMAYDITGEFFGTRDYQRAINSLTRWITEAKTRIVYLNESELS